jgi:ADP-dependent NAD(P)H-hydrate dehydratase / NAD(P)H-hydrate epimerase
VLPIATPDEMRAIDASASDSLDVLVGRAGRAVARTALDMLGGAYGRQVVVVAGRGNNGADGRFAARVLRRRGAQVRVFDVASVPAVLPRCDLVIDAAFGTGFRGAWTSPRSAGAPVLAVDIPSGVDGLTGAADSGVLPADRTVTFAALKPGLLLPPGAELAGMLELADIGLDVSQLTTHLVQHVDVAQWWRPRDADAHKWRTGVRAVAGSPGMLGAAHLATSAALRAGAGIVHLSSPGTVHDPAAPTEVVTRPLPSLDWASEVLSHLDRFAALLIGPGLGRDDHVASQVRQVVLGAPVPTVVDGDALFALAWQAEGAGALLRRRSAPTVLTPHDGEFALLTGSRPGLDRIASARRLAADTGAVVLLKGPATVVAEPFGSVLVVTAGDRRLATAGSGDVLTGIIGALLAQRVPAFHAAAAGAWIHGQAARRGPAAGLVAGDLPSLIPPVLDLLV